MSEKISRLRALQTARKRLSFMSEAKIEANLDAAQLTPAEAFMAGAEEAQCEIIKRLRAMPAAGEKRRAVPQSGDSSG